MKRLAPASLVVLPLLCLVGCAPTVVYRVDTSIAADGSCQRKAVITGRPSPRLPNHRVKLGDYMEFADAELYEKFVLTPDKVMFGGAFAEPEKIPCDFMKRTPKTSRVARNRILFRRMDFVLIEVLEYDERVLDIVNRGDAEEALGSLTTMLLNAALEALHDRFDKDYDLSALDTYLRGQVPVLVRRLYAYLWELRRARRGGLELLSETGEWRHCLCRELVRLGFAEAAELAKNDASVSKILMRLLEAKLQELTKPLRADVKPLSTDMFKGREARLALLASLQDSIKAHYGSMNAFSDKVEPFLPRVFGAYLINQISLVPINPEFEFHMRLAMPGHVVQTNGLCDLDGRILWSFTDRDVALSGYGMWARSLVVRDKALAALNLRGFPSHLHLVERFYQTLRSPDTGKICEPVMEALRASVKAKSLAPLEAVAQAASKDPDAATSEAVQAAKHLVEFLKQYQTPPVPEPPGPKRDEEEEPPEPDLPPPGPAPLPPRPAEPPAGHE